MRRTSRLLVLFGIGLAVLTFVLIVVLFSKPSTSGPGATPTPPVEVTVVVAAADIPLGTTVTSDMLTTKTVAANAARSDAFHDPSQAISQVARRPILTGAQVGDADFSVDQNSAVLAVPEGKRAIAVSVGELTGVGRLIYPGDTVDVVLTLDTKAIKVVTVQPPAKSPYAYDSSADATTVKAPVLLQNIQVLGTIQQAAAAQPAQAAGASPQPSGPTLTGQSKLIILAVTDAQAEAILFARTVNPDGGINLVLRSPADASAPPADTSGVILKTLFDTYGVLPPYVIRAIDAYIPQQP